MRRLTISDNTIRHTGVSGEQLSFRLKIEIAKHLDSLGVDKIETAPITDGKTDYLLVKSIASAVTGSTVTVPVDIMDPVSPAAAFAALAGASHPALQVPAPVSTVQMEYFCHRKPAAMIAMIGERVAACAALCSDVEFAALDFTRADSAFLKEAIDAAIAAGATTVTVADMAGNLLPDEFHRAVAEVKALLPENIKLGVQCSDTLFLADACAAAAVRAGADEVKTAILGRASASLERFTRILDSRSDVLGAGCGVKLTEVEHVSAAIREMCRSYRENPRMATGAIDEIAPEETGDDLPVPATYKLESYLINSGNITSSTCLLKLRKAGGEVLESVCVGNGPVDASFQAVEKVVGARYELDDFKIRSITEGREALGETVVLLRHEGKSYSGKGVSTDIVGSSILAYLDAANKIAYGEEQA